MADAFRKAALRCDPPPPAGLPSRSINKCDKPLGLKHDALSPSPRISAKKRTARSLIRSARAGHLLSARRNAGRRQRRRLRARATIWPPAILRDGYRRRTLYGDDPGFAFTPRCGCRASTVPKALSAETVKIPTVLALSHSTPATTARQTKSTRIKHQHRAPSFRLTKGYVTLLFKNPTRL